jgi:hypothetical protein
VLYLQAKNKERRLKQETIFYSWQSDVLPRNNRNLIEDALKRAIKAINKEASFVNEFILDRDTKGVLGAPIIAETVLDKVKKSSTFLADVTIIGKIDSGKAVINSNVSDRTRICFCDVTEGALILVFNLAYGRIEDLPFDLKHRRVMTYNLAEEATAEQRKSARQQLQNDLEKALRQLFQSRSKPPDQTAKDQIAQRPEPVFECDDYTRVVLWGVNWSTGEKIRTSPSREELKNLPSDITPVLAVLVRIDYQPAKGVLPYLYLRSRLFFHTTEKVLQKRVLRGIWNTDELKESTHIHAGRGLELIVALVPLQTSSEDAQQTIKLDSILTVEYNEKIIQGYWGTDVNVKPRLEAVQGKEFLIKAELVPKKSEELLDPQSLWFKLVLEREVKLSRVPEGD